jgi:ferredoxin-NADP reductase
VLAVTAPTTGITPFMAMIDQIMNQPRSRDAPRVFVIVDTGSDHRGKTAIKRLRDRSPNRIMIHTPAHASWLNQAEIFFSIIQRKVITQSAVKFTIVAICHLRDCSWCPRMDNPSTPNT